jgi:hypothetical protein
MPTPWPAIRNARDRFPYPGGDLIDDAARDGARERLQQAGFGPDRYEVLEGERDVGRIDLKGDEHGRAGTCAGLQAVLSDDADHARRYADICATVTTSSASPWATTRRPSSAPRTRSAQPTRGSSTTTPTTTSRTWAAAAEERRSVRCSPRRDGVPPGAGRRARRVWSERSHSLPDRLGSASSRMRRPTRPTVPSGSLRPAPRARPLTTGHQPATGPLQGTQRNGTAVAETRSEPRERAAGSGREVAPG